MKQLRYWSFLPALCLAALPLFGQHSIELGSATAEFGGSAEISITLNSDAEVQGVVVVIEVDGGTAQALEPGGAIAAADVIAMRVAGEYAILGVVMDSDGMDGEVIPPGTSDLGSLTVEAGSTAGDFPIALALDCGDPARTRDCRATVDGGPSVDNIIVIGGQSVGRGEGLGTVDGTLSVRECLPSMFIGGDPNNVDNGGAARVMMRNCEAVEGYVVALCHDANELALEAISVGDAANTAGAEFSDADIGADGGTLGVILDIEAPFGGQTIPVGTSNNIAIYDYRAVNPPQTGSRTTVLSFCDNVIGSPLKENVLVSGGLSVGAAEGLALIDGEYDILPEGVAPVAEQSFASGSRTARNPDGTPADVTGNVGGQTEVCFFILNPDDHIQGFSMAVSHDCALTPTESFNISGTILDAVGAEFVSIEAADCELVIGVLVDALPPFDGATIPPLDGFQRMGCVNFAITSDASACGSSLDISFTDGVSAGSGVPTKNLVSVENVALSPENTFGNSVTVRGREAFFRGDCNYSQERGGDAVNIADAAASISFMFPTFSPFSPPCLDACDCNDDGRIDLADTMCILNYLFRSGRPPPPPGSGLAGGGPGLDPTPDRLDCAAGVSCAN